MADAEPELKPGHPDRLPYVLARNTAPSGRNDFACSYVTVTEPHEGAAATGRVECLQADVRSAAA